MQDQTACGGGISIKVSAPSFALLAKMWESPQFSPPDPIHRGRKDNSAATAMQPFLIRAARRTVRPLPWRTPNKSARNGKKEERSAKSTAYTPATARARETSLFHRLLHRRILRDRILRHRIFRNE